MGAVGALTDSDHGRSEAIYDLILKKYIVIGSKIPKIRYCSTKKGTRIDSIRTEISKFAGFAHY
jgi:hypothetical protein